VGVFDLNSRMHALVESWAWRRPHDRLVARRPSHADRRKALRRSILDRQ
jgi:hypothetical protein